MSEESPEVPYDECRPYYECEKKGDECKFNKEMGTGVAASAIRSDGVSKSQLQQLAVCVEKFDANPIKSQKVMKGNKYQQAAFLLATLWEVTDTITISFMPLPPGYPGEQPQWDGSVIVPKPASSVGVTMAPDSQNACSTDGDCVKAMGTGYTCVDGNCVEDLMPKWYPKSIVYSNTQETLSPEEEEFEKKVRTMDPIEAIKLIVMEQLQPLLGLKLEFVEEGGDIRISLNNQGGSWSLVGVQCRTAPSEEATMNFGWLDVATIVHEFCHALGMIHEHQNPFGKGIDWNLKNVFAWANATQGWDMYTTCVNITKKYKLDTVNGSDYDPKSVMLYSFPGELTNNKVGTYRNIKLSEMDKEWLRKIYPRQGDQRVLPSQRESVGASASKEGDNAKKLSTGWIIAIVVIIIALIGIGVWMWLNKKKKSKK
jgi:hypothetical protein